MFAFVMQEKPSSFKPDHNSLWIILPCMCLVISNDMLAILEKRQRMEMSNMTKAVGIRERDRARKFVSW